MHIALVVQLGDEFETLADFSADREPGNPAVALHRRAQPAAEFEIDPDLAELARELQRQQVTDAGLAQRGARKRKARLDMRIHRDLPAGFTGIEKTPFDAGETAAESGQVAMPALVLPQPRHLEVQLDPVADTIVQI